MTSKLLIAAAGSGKTTFLVKEALKLEGPVLIITYTNANEASIRDKVMEINGHIPERITIQTWFSFILEHGIRPYHSMKIPDRIGGLSFKEPPPYTAKKIFRKYYFDDEMNVYRDKASDLALVLDKDMAGRVGLRIGAIFPTIMIDEAQDLSGYDYDFIEMLLLHSRLIMVGDPRQKTYSTNNSQKNNKYSTIKEFIEKQGLNINVDEETLTINYRSVPKICDFSSGLFPNMNIESGNSEIRDHQGVFFIEQGHVEHYLQLFPDAVELRYDRRRKCHGPSAYNFGESKGLEFDDVVIYLTDPMYNWIENHSYELKEESRCKFYVALTRARFSVALVIDRKHSSKIETNWHPDKTT